MSKKTEKKPKWRKISSWHVGIAAEAFAAAQFARCGVDRDVSPIACRSVPADSLNVANLYLRVRFIGQHICYDKEDSKKDRNKLGTKTRRLLKGT